MTAPTIRVHRYGYVTAGGQLLGMVRYDPAAHGWVASSLVADARGEEIALTRLRRDAVSALLDHVYPERQIGGRA